MAQAPWNTGSQKKGGKAKPLSAKVSIQRCRENLLREPSARRAIGIDFATFSLTFTEDVAEANARGSVALDSLHGRVGGGASAAAIQYLGAAAAGHGGQRCAEAAGAEPLRGRLDQCQ